MDQRFLVFVLVILPVLTVCAGVLVHVVVRPMIDALVEAIRELSRVVDLVEPGEHARLVEEVDRLRGEVEALRAGRDFDRELLGSGED